MDFCALRFSANVLKLNISFAGFMFDLQKVKNQLPRSQKREGSNDRPTIEIQFVTVMNHDNADDSKHHSVQGT